MVNGREGVNVPQCTSMGLVSLAQQICNIGKSIQNVSGNSEKNRIATL